MAAARRRPIRWCCPVHLGLVLTIFLTSTLRLSRGQTTDTLKPGDFINDDGGFGGIVSANGIFKLGFFSPGGSSSRYVGVWYMNIAVQTVVWVANREKPFIRSNFGKLTLDRNGDLNIVDSNDGSVVTVVQARGWSTASSTAILLDSGNLVLRGAPPNQTVLWQSFDHPTDTWLPGMRSLYFFPWKSPTDPSPGDCDFYMSYMDEPGISLRVRQKDTVTWSSGGLTHDGVSGNVSAPWASYYPDAHLRFVNDSKTQAPYFVYDATTSASSLTRVVMEAEGQVRLYAWSNGDEGWKVFWAAPGICEVLAHCGPNSLCNSSATPVCRCLPGFIPDSSSEWAAGDWALGCVRRLPTTCDAAGAGGDMFVRLPGVTLPGNANRTVLEYPVRDETVEARTEECLADCNCTAYASDCRRYPNNSTGCSVWHVQEGQLVGLRANNSGGIDLYLRVAAAELNPTSNTTTSDGRKRQLSIALPIIFGTLLFFGVGLCYFLRIKRGDEEENSEELLLRDIGMDGAVSYKFVDVNEGGAERGPEIYLYSFSNVLAATDNFSDDNKLGEGGFGPVYKGKLPDEQEIAIKRLSTRSRQGLEEFKNEILLIARLQHKNLVRLLGCCIQGEERLLIYEYMPNKSLDFFLFDPKRAAQLDWGRRTQIIEGIAQGVLYLHKYSRLTVIHRDLKASNILLDNAMNPKISDFGMARVFSSNEDQATTNRIVGTYGYMSPEYAMEGLFSTKSDVFSFGVLLLEIISGRKNISSHDYTNFPRSLLSYVWELWNGGTELELLDPSLGGSYIGREVSRYIYIGLMCVQESIDDRPSMVEVVGMLSSELLVYQVPKQPAFFVGRSTIQERSSSTSADTSTNNVSISIGEGK